MHITGAGDKAPSTKKVLSIKGHSLSPTGVGDAALTAGAAPSHHSQVGASSLPLLGEAPLLLQPLRKPDRHQGKCLILSF